MNKSCKGPVCTCGSMRCKNMIGIPILIGPIEPELNLTDYQDTYNNTYRYTGMLKKYVPTQTLGYPDGGIEQESTSKATYVHHAIKKPKPFSHVQGHYRQCKRGTNGSRPKIYNPLEIFSADMPRDKKELLMTCYQETHRAFLPREVDSKQATKVPQVDNITILPGKIWKRSVSKRDFPWHKVTVVDEENEKKTGCIKIPKKKYKAFDQKSAIIYWPRSLYRDRAKNTRLTRGDGDNAALHARVQTDITRVAGEGLAPRSPQIDFETEPLGTPEPMPDLLPTTCQKQRARATSFRMDLDQRCKNNNCRCDICTAQSGRCDGGGDVEVPPTPPCSQRSALLKSRRKSRDPARPETCNEKKEGHDTSQTLQNKQTDAVSPYDVVKAVKSSMSVRSRPATQFHKSQTPDAGSPVDIATPCLRRRGGPATPGAVASSPPALIRPSPAISRSSRRTVVMTPKESDEMSIHIGTSNGSEQSVSATAEISNSLERIMLSRPGSPTPALGKRVPVVRPPFAVDTWVV